ncbi:MAG TPA: ABC transporter permease [Bryobacteraceae bacterium]|nr:ABC transporter permease [Bryobacteraceae bacterium]
MFTWLEQVFQDLHFSTRNFSKTPGFVAAAVLSLALGIGATTAIFSVIYGVIIDPFPYSHPETLYSFMVNGDRGVFFFPDTPDQYIEIAERNRAFSDLVASTISDVFWTGTGEPRRLRGNFVTVNTFRVMGVKPLLGRYIDAGDGKPEAQAVAVLGYTFWMRQFGGDPAVLGRTLRLNDKVRTVIGVMPKRFMWRGADVYLPVVFKRGQFAEDVHQIFMMGRLKPGVTEAEAMVDLHPILADLMVRDHLPVTKFNIVLRNFYETFPSSIRKPLWTLFGAVSLLLLIACTNVSSLMLTRAAARGREMALRAALGAGRGRVIRQLLTESALIGIAACVLGVILAYLGLHAILSIVPPDTIPDESEVTLNVPVLVFSVLVSLLAAFLLGLAPALQAARTNVAEALKSAGRGVSGVFREGRIRGFFVVVEVALAMILLVGASLVIRTLLQLEQVHVGVQPDQVLTMVLPLPERRYPTREARNAFFLQLLDRASEVPGLQTVALNSFVHPFANFGSRLVLPGNAGAPPNLEAVVSQISSGYPEMVGLRLMRGRLLTPDDVRGAQKLAVVNEKLAKLFTKGGALGEMIQLPGIEDSSHPKPAESFQIVGVVSDEHNIGLQRETLPEAYIPFTTTGYLESGSATLLATSNTSAASLIKPLEAKLQAIDPDQPVMEVRTMRQMLDAWGYSEPRFSVFLFSIFAGLGLLLAALGIYSVINYSVVRQTQEIGVRMALGAQRPDILKMILWSGLKLLLVGAAVGLAGSLSLTRLLRGMIWGVSPFDPISFIAVLIAIFAIGLLACAHPALRASRVDPMTALRYE